ncbi:hypothetical protein TWF192_004240 [Orbilia oligospora]|uniref:Uncharacterized protein n=1 Tax=Orbilia oligospora TaxID=2813651 RepID=A0A6G1MC18_ORBOL|nr:hypothetical protein TWF191_002394 [Orbilia oligospora]KAF3252955.1 hypothetical protein TWF192_004240 [Orbilia oligospora]
MSHDGRINSPPPSPSKEEEEFPASKRRKPETSFSKEGYQNAVVPSLRDIVNAPDLTILVGPCAQPFDVHQSVILPKSPMLASFTRTIATPFFPKNKEITLPELSPYSFKIILSYIYNGKSSLKKLKTDEDILQAYEAADYLIMKEMKGEILEYVAEVVEEDGKIGDNEKKLLPFEMNLLRELCVFSQKTEFRGLAKILEAYVKGNPELMIIQYEDPGDGESGYEEVGEEEDEEETLGLDLYLQVWEEVLKMKLTEDEDEDEDEEGNVSDTLIGEMAMWGCEEEDKDAWEGEEDTLF